MFCYYGAGFALVGDYTYILEEGAAELARCAANNVQPQDFQPQVGDVVASQSAFDNAWYR